MILSKIISYALLALVFGFSVYQGAGYKSKYDNIPTWVVTLLIAMVLLIRWVAYDLTLPE